MTSLPTTTRGQVPQVTGRGQVAQGSISGGSEINVRSILGMLLRNIWLILTVFLLIQVATWGWYAAARKYQKEYTAVGRMRVVPPENLWVPGQQRLDPFAVSTQKRDAAAAMTSEFILLDMLQRPEARRWDWVEQHSGDKNRPLVDLLREKIRATPVNESLQIEVAITDSNPEHARRMVNRVMHFYADRTRSGAFEKTREERQVFEQLRSTLRAQLDNLEANLNEMRGSADFEQISRVRPEIINRVNALGNLRTNLMIQLQALQRANARVEEQIQSPDWRPSAEMQLRIDSDPTLLNMEARRRGLLEERAVLLDRGFGPTHQQLRAIDVRIDEVDASLRSRRAELMQMARNHAVENVKGQLAETQAQLGYVEGQLAEAEARKRDILNRGARYEAMERERERKRGELDDVNDRLRQINTEMSRNAPEVEVMIEASAPRQISYPRWETFLAGGVVLGLALAIGLAWLLEFMDTSVRTPRDISEHVRLPLLGFVPQFGDDMDLAQASHLASSDPTSMVAECFRQVRTNLLFAAPADQINSITVTSASQSEGKTSVACNLAITIALSGRRVLLVDANFRRPVMADIFGLDASVGLSNVLTNQAELSDAIRPGDVPNLDVLVSGPTPPNPAELLGSATMRGLLDKLANEYDLAIFDSPPGLLVSDPLILGTMVDGVIFVVRAKEASRGMVGRLRDQMAKVKARVVGVVLNAAQATRGGYFRKSQQQYERYQMTRSIGDEET